MHERTESDLKKLELIENHQRDLRHEAERIRKECLCLDYRVDGMESLSFDVTPKAVCPVCEKILNKELSVQEKVTCLKQHLDLRDDSTYTEEDYVKMAVDGGFIYPSFRS